MLLYFHYPVLQFSPTDLQLCYPSQLQHTWCDQLILCNWADRCLVFEMMWQFYAWSQQQPSGYKQNALITLYAITFVKVWPQVWTQIVTKFRQRANLSSHSTNTAAAALVHYKIGFLYPKDYITITITSYKVIIRSLYYIIPSFQTSSIRVFLLSCSTPQVVGTCTLVLIYFLNHLP